MAALKYFLIGNDINISVTFKPKTIASFNIEKDYTDKKLYLVIDGQKKLVDNPSYKENTVSFTHLGKDQKGECSVSILLVVNEGEEGMRSFKLDNAYQLVSEGADAGQVFHLSK